MVYTRCMPGIPPICEYSLEPCLHLRVYARWWPCQHFVLHGVHLVYACVPPMCEYSLEPCLHLWVYARRWLCQALSSMVYTRCTPGVPPICEHSLELCLHLLVYARRWPCQPCLAWCTPGVCLVYHQCVNEHSFKWKWCNSSCNNFQVIICLLNTW